MVIQVVIKYLIRIDNKTPCIFTASATPSNSRAIQNREGNKTVKAADNQRTKEGKIGRHKRKAKKEGNKVRQKQGK